jgi:hypothetical protein
MGVSRGRDRLRDDLRGAMGLRTRLTRTSILSMWCSQSESGEGRKYFTYIS